MLKYKFGHYLLTEDGDFFHHGERIALPPKELDLLRVFIRNHGVLLSKNEIIQAIWKGGHVSDESLTRCVYTLRRLLGDNKNYIRTSYGRGYRFTSPLVVKIESAMTYCHSLDAIMAC
ncbi:winged helix-turn-helix domain-containing protein [Serratia quinivorans]|uniref:winged helix-turn-helix domain-containing protein n=1 Tax=Serratia quinivorans TaxID=137545 RepID=UPI003981A57A